MQFFRNAAGGSAGIFRPESPMNSLDRAFLKAYAKQTVAGDCYQRLDAAHSDADSAAGRFHASFSTPETPPPQPSPASASLKMTSVFLTPDDPDEADSFSPDWEVDRFTWPDLCGRLLDAQRRYFRHVGEQLKAATDQSHHVVMVSGCRRGEGRTTLALCLAHSAAAAGVDVAVVDADWQNPQIGTRLGMEMPCGWTDALAGKKSLNEAAVTSIEDRLTLFPLRIPNESPVRLGDHRPSQVLRKIAARFPLVIIDASPLGSDDGSLFAGEEDCFVDAAIVVRDVRHTSEEEVLVTARRLQHSGIAAVGIAENFESK
jgi:Mrp family chromosome partitioning ATPase